MTSRSVILSRGRSSSGWTSDGRGRAGGRRSTICFHLLVGEGGVVRFAHLRALGRGFAHGITI